MNRESKFRHIVRKEKKEIVFYTDSSLSRKDSRDKLMIRYSIIQYKQIAQIIQFLNTKEELKISSYLLEQS